MMNWLDSTPVKIINFTAACVTVGSVVVGGIVATMQAVPLAILALGFFSFTLMCGGLVMFIYADA